MKKKIKKDKEKYCLNNCYVDLEGEKKKSENILLIMTKM